MDNFIYIPIKNNTKESAVKWKHLKATHPLTTKFENRAILTGSLSNIIVVDIDKFDKWNEYLTKYGEPKTLKSKSPKGEHYYFKYTEQLSKSCVNIREGIDIRSNGGYILCEPSKINNKEYKFDNKNTPIIDIPDELLFFLCVEQESPKEKKEKKEQPATTLSNDIYYIDDYDLFKLLDKLPKKYYDDRHSWLSVSDVLKGMNHYEAFEKLKNQLNTIRKVMIRIGHLYEVI